ncbi:hypothetical protein [Micromonospora saelicesensis]|uniref:hypothetical protein n=1 Tax=Micromonospora saelicesensis TaxID=285676 RepID=UPI0011BFAAAE|nr:hypothetical protein [Micromonospora saelicesensis]
MKTEERSTPPVTIEPLISAEERNFIEGNLSAHAYLTIGQKEMEREVEIELAHRRHRPFRWLSLLFSTLGAGVYVVTSLVFLLVEKSNFGSAAAGAVSVAFTALALGISASGRHARRTRGHKHRMLKDA